MTREQRCRAKAQVVATMNQERSWQEAVAKAPLTVYIDSHRKLVYSEHLIPRDLIVCDSSHLSRWSAWRET
jgi:hypothetical protein